MKNYILFIVLFLFYSNLFAQWEPDIKLSGTDPASTNENMGKCIAVNGSIIHVVWVQTTDGSGIYYKRSTDAGVSWSIGVRLTPVPSISDFPSIAVSGNMVHVAYRDSTPGLRTSNYIRSTDGGNTWNAPVSLGNFYWWPSVAVAGSNVYVALNSFTSGNSEVWFRRSTDNGVNWDVPVQISNAAGRSEDPSIAAGGNTVHIAWNDNRTDTMQTFYRRSTDGGVTWGPEIQRTNSSVFAYCPSLSVSGSDVDLVWADRRNGNYDIYHLYSSDFGSSWGSEERLSFDNLSSVYPTLIRSGTNVHVVWTGSGLFYLHSGDGGVNWDSQVKLVNESSNPAMSFVNVTGNVLHLLWTDRRDGYNAVYYKRNPSGNAGEPPNSITVTSTQLQLCSGSDFVIQYQTSGTFFGDNIFTAQLSDGTGNFSNPIDIGTINASSSGSITATLPTYLIPALGYRVRVNSSSPPLTGTKNNSDITINPLPSPKISGASEVCRNSTLIFTTDTITGHRYRWTATGGVIQGADNGDNVVVYWNTAETTGSIHLSETANTTGCNNLVSKEIKINSPPSATIQGSPNACRNITQIFNSPYYPFINYLWTVNGGEISGPINESSVSVNWTTSGSSGTISLNVLNNVTGCVNSGFQVVAIYPLPVPGITGTSALCNKSTASYTASAGSGNSFQWRVTGGAITGADNQQTVQINWNTSDLIGTVAMIQTVDSTGCSDSVSKIITIYPLPVPSITGPLTSIKNMNQNYSVFNNPGSVYQWSVEGGIFVGKDNIPDVIVHWGEGESGKLKVVETDSRNCIDSTEITVSLLINSVDDFTKDNFSVNIYPNPSSGIINFEFFNSSSDIYDFEITNVYGQTVKKLYSGRIDEGKFKLNWDGSDSASNQVFSGIYFVSIKNRNNIQTEKFIIVR